MAVNWGVGIKGFLRKNFLAIVEDQKQRLRQDWRSDLNLSDRSPVTHLVKADAMEKDLLWQACEALFYAFYLPYSRGAALVNGVRFRGITKTEAQYGIGQVTLSPVPVGTTIPAGFTFRHEGGVVAQTTADAVGTDLGTADAPAQALSPGPLGNFAAGSTFTILTTSTNVDSVTNLSAEHPARLGATSAKFFSIPNDGKSVYYQTVARSFIGHPIGLQEFAVNFKNEEGSKNVYLVRLVLLDDATGEVIHKSSIVTLIIEAGAEQAYTFVNQAADITNYANVRVAIVNLVDSTGALSIGVDTNSQYSGGAWHENSVAQTGEDMVLEIKSSIDGQFRNGVDEETDTELRKRYDKVLHLGGSGRTEAIKSELFATKGVFDVEIIDNSDASQWTLWVNDPTNPNIPPPGSLEVIVWGGDDQDIINAIGRVKGSGTPTIGTSTGFYIDKYGQVFEVKYSRPTIQNIYVSVKLTKNSFFRPGMEERVRDTIIKYIGGVSSSNTFFKGLGPGRDVSHGEVVERVMDIQGIDDVEIKIGTSQGSEVEDPYDTPLRTVPQIADREHVSFV